MSKWIIKTNFGYVTGSSGFSNKRVSYSDSRKDATYLELQDARIFAAEIMERASEAVLYVQLESLEEQS